MFESVETFNFIDKMVGVTKDGEKYIAINVISKDNQKLNFLSKDENLINKIGSLNIERFKPIRLRVIFNRIFNKEKRTSYWSIELVGVE